MKLYLPNRCIPELFPDLRQKGTLEVVQYQNCSMDGAKLGIHLRLLDVHLGTYVHVQVVKVIPRLDEEDRPTVH